MPIILFYCINYSNFLLPSIKILLFLVTSSTHMNSSRLFLMFLFHLYLQFLPKIILNHSMNNYNLPVLVTQIPLTMFLLLINHMYLPNLKFSMTLLLALIYHLYRYRLLFFIMLCGNNHYSISSNYMLCTYFRI